MRLSELRSYRVGGTALFDWAVSLATGAAVGWWAMGLRWQAHAWALWLVFWVLLGVFVHRAFGVETAFGKVLGM